MRSKGLGLVAAVGGVLLFAAAGTPAHATFWCKGGTHGFGAAKTRRCGAGRGPGAARKHAWIGKRHAWRSARAYGYAAAPGPRRPTAMARAMAIRRRWHGSGVGVAIGVAVAIAARSRPSLRLPRPR